MNAIELKFVLKLLGLTDYRTSLAKIQLTSQTKAPEREKICQQLCAQGLVECSYEITKLKIAPPGKALLKLDPTKLPVTKQDLEVLQAICKEKISPEQTIPTAERQIILQDLAERGLIEVETKIKEVWLSERGKEFLRDEYTPKGSQPTVSLDMLNNYCRFLRKSLSVENGAMHGAKNGAMHGAKNGAMHGAKNGALPHGKNDVKNGASQAHTESQPSDKDILQLIQDLDRHLGTENYLPIFHLRQKLEPQLTREQLDRTLYRLQRHDLIELSSLQEVIAYTPEQIDSGIPQDVGGPLFFIIVN